MSLEQVFVRGCYYYLIGNPVWHIHHAKVVQAMKTMSNSDMRKAA